MNETNHIDKAKRATAKFAKFIFPFYCFYKKVKEAYEEINQFTWYFALFFSFVLIALAYDEYNKKAEDDELGKLRRERDVNKKYAKIGKLFVEGKLPPSSLLKEVKCDKIDFTHMTIHAVVNGKSHLTKGSSIFWNGKKANEAKANYYNKKHGELHNDDYGESFDTELYDKCLFATMEEAEKFIQAGGNTEERREAREIEILSPRQDYLVDKWRKKLNKYGYNVTLKEDEKKRRNEFRQKKRSKTRRRK